MGTGPIIVADAHHRVSSSLPTHTRQGLSDLAAHFLTKAGISAIRRLRKTDNNRIARCGVPWADGQCAGMAQTLGTGAWPVHMHACRGCNCACCCAWLHLQGVRRHHCAPD